MSSSSPSVSPESRSLSTTQMAEDKKKCRPTCKYSKAPQDILTDMSRYKRIGDDGSHYQVKKKNLEGRKTEAGMYFDILCKDRIQVEGKGENIEMFDSFEEMGLNPILLRNLKENGVVRPLPIQRAAIALIQQGYDVIGHAQTGAGKTAAFLVPVIDWILKRKAGREYDVNCHPYCVIISPTRELSEQLYNVTRAYTKNLNCTTVVAFGDMRRSENIRQIKIGCDILIATVGRLCDFLVKNLVDFRNLHYMIFDEADRLLVDLGGFARDVKEYVIPRISRLQNVQKILFSATDSGDFEFLEKQLLSDNATKVIVGVLNSVSRLVKQTVLQVSEDKRSDALLELIARDFGFTATCDPPKTMVFVNTKRKSSVVACYLSIKGYKAYPVSANLTTALRREAIDALESGKCHILVCTDVASRGLDISNISHVINYEIPRRESWTSYIHRLGRTGRVGNVGRATTLYSPETDAAMALILYKWLLLNGQTIPSFLYEQAMIQSNQEDLQRKAAEMYLMAGKDSMIPNSESEDDD